MYVQYTDLGSRPENNRSRPELPAPDIVVAEVSVRGPTISPRSIVFSSFYGTSAGTHQCLYFLFFFDEIVPRTLRQRRGEGTSPGLPLATLLQVML